jgi:hypothetical protein
MRYMHSFDIHPFVGALPIQFGMPRIRVHELLGPPESTNPVWDGSGIIDYWHDSRVNVGYDRAGTVNHIGFVPGEHELRFLGSVLWSAEQQPDPNPELLRRDAAPRESLGILVFPRLGITTTGYHDGDDNQRALTAFPSGAWDQFLQDSTAPDLTKYRLER